MINRNQTITFKPEDILANDNFVDFFHPRDIRTLTYLGYLSINEPEYKLLAQKMTADNSEIFILKKGGITALL